MLSEAVLCQGGSGVADTFYISQCAEGLSRDVLSLLGIEITEHGILLFS